MKNANKTMFSVFLMVLLAVVLLSLAACNSAPAAAPTPEPTATEDSNLEEVVAGEVEVSNAFTDNDSGLYPDTFFNTTILNTGHRGCNACHENLFDVWDMLETEHIIPDVGYEAKNGRITDCLACHQIHADRTGVYLADVIHASHYSSETFLDEYEGNCWSCHSMNSVGYSGDGTLNSKGEFQWLLWEDIMYSGALGGHPDVETNVGAREFNIKRGFGDSGYITSVSVDDGSAFEITLSQEITPEEDVFIVNNFGTQVIDPKEWTLEITGGVNNPRSFTLEELQALPQTELIANMVCGTNGIGTAFFGNIPVTGVLLADVIEACGGLSDGTNMMYMTGYDSWMMPFCVEDLVANNSIIALQMWGHDLTADQGYPATVVNPGMQGASWVKWIASISFTADEFAFNPFKMDINNDQKQQLLNVNSCWLANDGETYQLGDTIEINGWSWAASGVVGSTSKIEFSADYGVTWITIDVPDTFDKYQLVNWNFKWTPTEAGTYVLKVQAEADDGFTQNGPDNVIVTVVE